ncbi:MAG: MarR family transcriptional regulator [Chlorobi bacterium]|nr:MarR family transcriptional regulator [Chlorobiota bacterium]
MKIEEEIHGRFRNEFHKARINIYYTNNYLTYRFLSLMKKYGLTPVQYNVLRILRSQYPGAVSIQYIRERLLDSRPDVSRLIDRLYARKLIARVENKDDRRVKDIRIEKNGLELIAGMDHCEQELDHPMSNLTEKEAIQLNTLLDKIRSSG